MPIRIGLENGIEGRSLAWALDYPGCFAYGKDGTEALIAFPRAIIKYKQWIDSRAQESWLTDLSEFHVRLEEVFECYNIDENYNPAENDIEINAWFRDDWRPLTEVEIEHGTLMLHWTREDLLDLIAGLTKEQMDAEHPGELWPIRGIVKHIANGEHWYLRRFGREGIPRSELPENELERLEVTRKRVYEVLSAMAGDRTVVGVMGEFWSPRKFLRRTLWHELDHIQHIQKLAYPSK